MAPHIHIPKKPPIYVRTDTPVNFKTSLDKQRYWALEKKRWLEGYENLPGTYYHFLQEQMIKDRTKGNTLRPRPLERDLIIHEKIRECREKLKSHLLIYKARNTALSTTIGSLTNYFMRAYPGSTCNITSADQARIANLYNDKIKVCFDNYNPDIRYKINKKNEGQARTYLQIAIKYLDSSGIEQIGYSDVKCYQTSNSDEDAMAFSGTGAIFGGYDEGPLNKRIVKVLKSSEECYRDSLTGEMSGFLLVGGTVEEGISSSQLYDFLTLVESKDIFKMEEMFIPFQWRFHDENGYLDLEAAEKWYEVEYARKAKSSDPSDLIAFKKNNPRSRDDIFDLATSGVFEDDVSDKIKVQLNEVRGEKPAKFPELKYSLSNIGGAVRGVPDKTRGVFDILEMPKPGCLYYSCVDGVATGKQVSGDEGSKVASIIMKMYDPDINSFSYMPVCVYHERPSTVEQSYFHISNQAMFYNVYDGFKGFSAEANASTADHFATFLSKEGLSRYVIMRKDLSGKGYSNTKRVFQYVTPSVRDYQIKMANPFLRKYIQSLRHKGLLQDLMKPSTENADLRDAFLMFFVAVPPDFDKPIEKTVSKYTSTLVLEYTSEGTRWKEVRVKVKGG